MTQPVYRLMYRSRSLLPPDTRRRDLGALFTEARSNNKRRRITGALLVAGDCFVQTLEGDEPAVRELFDHISADERHTDVTVVESGDVTDRVFARWSMARVSEDENEPDVNMLARTDGIADAAPRGDQTAEQAELLRSMRDAAHGQAPVG